MALDAVGPDHPAADVPAVLRPIARAYATTRPEAVGRAYADLRDLLLTPGRFTDVGTAALPFLVALALDQDEEIHARDGLGRGPDRWHLRAAGAGS
ncbi:hypothetical protein ACGFNX_03650 [Streptomyces sp. NPDC048723]|uniref:hypothetical protein n=1 Tax=Streptomyces sp. NPDC048723 TaxID=3365589 RepID=UPI00371AF219